MSFPVDYYTKFLSLTTVFQTEDLLETRIENNIDGQPIYIGKNITANADTAAFTWSLVKVTYDVNGFITRTQLPDDAQGYKYSWDDRTTYFS